MNHQSMKNSMLKRSSVKPYVGIGLSVGLLAGVWTQVSTELGLITWVAFIAWACFFAAGGGVTGLTKGLAGNLSGVAWGWVAGEVATRLGFNGSLAISVAVIAFFLCAQASFDLLSFIPAAFAGTAVYFGTAFDGWGCVIALAIGALLGIASEYLGGRFQAMLPAQEEAPAPAAAV